MEVFRMITKATNRRTLLTLAAVCGLWFLSNPAVGGQVAIVKLLSNDLPLYDPETMAEVERLQGSQVTFPIMGSLNDMGMYDAMIRGKKYWINPADVVTEAADKLKQRCFASADNQGKSSSARAFGSGCQ
jgi:hypothetical protein